MKITIDPNYGLQTDPKIDPKVKGIVDQYIKSDIVICHQDDMITNYDEIIDNIFDTLKENGIEFNTDVDKEINSYLEEYMSDLGYPYLFISSEVNDLRKKTKELRKENKDLKDKLENLHELITRYAKSIKAGGIKTPRLFFH